MNSLFEKSEKIRLFLPAHVAFEEGAWVCCSAIRGRKERWEVAITGVRPELKKAIREAAIKSRPPRPIGEEAPAMLERQYGFVADVLTQISARQTSD